MKISQSIFYSLFAVSGLLGGIRVALALPAYICAPNTTNLSRDPRVSEAIETVGFILRAQESHRLSNPTFADSIAQLGLQNKTESNHYSFEIIPQKNKAKSVMINAIPKYKSGRSIAGAAFALKNEAGKDMTMMLFCQANQPATAVPNISTIPQSINDHLKCPSGSTMIP